MVNKGLNCVLVFIMKSGITEPMWKQNNINACIIYEIREMNFLMHFSIPALVKQWEKGCQTYWTCLNNLCQNSHILHSWLSQEGVDPSYEAAFQVLKICCLEHYLLDRRPSLHLKDQEAQIIIISWTKQYFSIKTMT